MPFVVTALPPQAAEVRPFWQTSQSAIAQGLEGQQLREQIETVSRHWQQQSLNGTEELAGDQLDELTQYKHLPFDRVGVRRVRYVRINELQPRKFIRDENDS